ncbi:unnamed protein product [Ranitomeya imitator]|uniref:START domain-containing protein n=1 Tax=Ranitomeya imitator TaxID=111125 RepID=A0ABN9LXS3_9NEOB|nr:unnamed protein product [Ranitomeya imitator]
MSPNLRSLVPTTVSLCDAEKDNDPKHTSRLCKGYLTKKKSDGILRQMTWPPQSPDLNPIEMVWGKFLFRPALNEVLEKAGDKKKGFPKQPFPSFRCSFRKGRRSKGQPSTDRDRANKRSRGGRSFYFGKPSRDTKKPSQVMTACSYNIKKLYNRQAAAGWIYQSTERDVLVYYKAFSSATKHGFIGAGVIRRPIHDVWCMVKDISTRRLYDQSILTACVHERVSSNIQLVHVMTDTSLCYLKQPRDFCCMAVEYKQEKCYSLCFQSVYNEDMPRPSKDTVRGELLPSAWILQPDNLHGEDITRVIYMIQVDLGAPAIPSRLLSVVSKRQPLVIANLATFLSR